MMTKSGKLKVLQRVPSTFFWGYTHRIGKSQGSNGICFSQH